MSIPVHSGKGTHPRNYEKVNVPSLINKMEFCFKVSGMLYFPAFFCLHQKRGWVEENTGQPNVTGIFSAILGRGPRAFLIGKISDITQNLGIFQNIQRL